MRKWRQTVLLGLAAACLLAACTGDGGNASAPAATADRAADAAALPEGAEQPLINLDELEQYGVITGSGPAYTDAELERLAGDEEQRDYVAVLRHFVRQELQREIRYLDSVDGAYNPRHVIVGTTDGDTYRVSLRKRYDYDGIWTVYSYARFEEDGAVPPAQTVGYELVDDLAALPETVRKQVDERIAARTEERGYIDDDGTIYILLTAPQGESVELLNVFGGDDSIDVQYTTTETPFSSDGTETTLMFGENPYMLIRVNSPVIDIRFTKYAGVTEELIRLNMP